MYSRSNCELSELPAKTLCLTYDDGPGPYTLEIAEFLHQNGVRATFFVVGKYAYHHQDILEKIKALGHIIGNHTQEHPDMPYYQSVDGELSYQVIRTDLLIRQYTGEKVFFRAPYGKWSAEVADELNENILSSLDHIGPIHWDIAGFDCYYWRNDWPIEDALAKYLEEIHAKGRGIIVMHDDIADMDFVKPKNQTLELTKMLVIKLLEQGYRFVGLDEIESVKKEWSQPDKFSLAGRSGKYMLLASSGAGIIKVDGRRNDPQALLTLEHLGHGKVALKAANGLYLNVEKGSSEGVMANSHKINDFTAFDLVQLRDSQLIFRTYNGNFLNIDKKNGNMLMSSVEYMRQAEIFYFIGHDAPGMKPVSLKRRLFLLKKGMLFIKSKILKN